MNDETRQRLHDINEQIIQLRNEYHRLHNSTIESTQDELRKHIGRCFKQPSENTWCIIYDVPQPEYCMTHTNFNENQMPAMFLHFLPEVKDGLPWIEYDTFFTGDFPEDKRNIFDKHNWQETTLGEFWKAMSRFYFVLTEQVQVRVASAAASEFAKLAQSGLSKEKPNGGWFETNKKLAEEMSDE